MLGIVIENKTNDLKENERVISSDTGPLIRIE